MMFRLLFLVAGVLAASEFAAHRMVQFEVGSERFGAQRTTLNLLAGSLKTSSDLAHRALVIRMHEMTPKIVQSLCSGSLAVGAVLIVLPTNASDVSPETLAEWKSFEQMFLKSSISVPVYFTFAAPDVDDVYTHIAQEGSDGYRLVVNDGEAAPISSVPVVNLQSTLLGQGGIGGDEDNLPTIAIVTHYDTFGVAPSLAVGADDNGSGVVTFLELARLFSKLYRRMNTQGKYNIVFVLTGAGRENFAGAKHWLDNADTRLLENIELALCIDALGAGDSVYLHISKPAKDPEILRLYNQFQHTANESGVSFDLIHKKINLADPEIYWQHEQFSRKRVLSATVSHHAQASPSLEHGSIFDRAVNVTTLKRNIKFLAEVLASHIYGFHGQNLEVFTGSLDVNDDFVSAWQRSLSQHPRMQPFLSTPKNVPAPIVDGLEKVMEAYTTSVSKDTFTLSGPAKFYGVGEVRMSAFKVKPATFDLALTVAILIYFAVLFFALQGFGPGIEKLKGLFSSKSTMAARGKRR